MSIIGKTFIQIHYKGIKVLYARILIYIVLCQ